MMSDTSTSVPCEIRDSRYRRRFAVLVLGLNSRHVTVRTLAPAGMPQRVRETPLSQSPPPPGE